MEHHSLLPKARCLDARYSTTRLVADTPPGTLSKPGNTVERLQELAAGKQCRSDGGLRTRGIHKRTFPNKPLVTVITVVFNAASTLGDTIESVLNQTYDNVEYIIIDGGSIDGTLEIIRKYEHLIDYWTSEKDAGIYDAMNKGIALAKGDYIGMLNSDDFFSSPSVLVTIAACLVENRVDAVFSCLDIVDPANLDRVLRKYRVSKFSQLMLRIGVMPPHPTFYCRRSVYETATPYRTDYRIAADFEMLVRLLLKHRITWRFINETTVKMRCGGLSSSGLKSSFILNQEIIRACTENGLYTNMFMLAFKLPIRLMERIL